MARTYAALIRHGDYQQRANTPSAHQPHALTRRGEQEARQCVDTLLAWQQQQACRLCSHIDSSPLLRAWQTAQILAQSLSDEMQVCGYPELAERSVGNLANLSLTEIEAVLAQDPRYAAPPKHWKSDSFFRLPGIGTESLEMAGERVAAHLQRRLSELAAQSETDVLQVFVGHGAAMRHAAWKLGVLQFSDLSSLSMHHARPVFLEFQPGRAWKHLAGEWKLRQSEQAALD